MVAMYVAQTCMPCQNIGYLLYFSLCSVRFVAKIFKIIEWVLLFQFKLCCISDTTLLHCAKRGNLGHALGGAFKALLEAMQCYWIY
jgi:hypothetical protein